MIGFRMPTRVHIRPGCLADLPDVLQSLDLDRILLVVDRGLMGTPWPAQIQNTLAAAKIHLTLFDGVEPDPQTTTAEALADLIRAESLIGVVSLGGGSVMDAGKAAAMLATNAGHALDYEGRNQYQNTPLPFIAIPTTCGTGSEVTWVSVLTHTAGQRKISVKGDTMFPTQALVDANLLKSLPPHLIAYTGMDALTHALEATTGKAANPVSDAMAEKAIALIFKYLDRAVADIKNDDEARASIMQASTIAGMAFGNADVGAVHCLSETMGGLYHVSHGLGNAILLLPVMRYHKPCITDRLADLSRQLWPYYESSISKADLATYFLERIATLTKRLEIPPFASLSIDSHDFAKIASIAVTNNSNESNPQPMRAENYRQILENL